MKQDLIMGVYRECHKQIDNINLLSRFERHMEAEMLARPLTDCQRRSGCPLVERCQALLAFSLSSETPANDSTPKKGRTFKNDDDWVNTQHLPLHYRMATKNGHIRDMYSYWQDMRHEKDALPTLDSVNPMMLNRMAGGKFHIIRKTDSGSYRIWRYGAEVTLDGGYDWTGLVVAEHPNRVYAQGLQADFFEAEMLGAPILAKITAKLGMQTRMYERLILPLLGGREKTFIVGVNF